ncbi:PTS sugar transporter subunit IIA [Lapidilactobacillus luobeiensis]|uniref:PTS sugar transporter subunit IIA n=1 Tax=Lapidilactobacillus luobeiensis TaxID=2950371 RepID=UPI0021C324B1|nr:PTS fructose transporter subunit IIA [Lapidilactobacillus luobeiensis]
MKQILVATHGGMASGIKSSIEILTGLQDKLDVIDAYIDENDLKQGITKFIKQLEGTTGVILTDIIGGSVSQEVLLQVHDQKNIFVITGVNLPIVLSLVMNSETLSSESLKRLVDQAQLAVLQPAEGRLQIVGQNDDFFETKS